jgi:hypothetical protein
MGTSYLAGTGLADTGHCGSCPSSTTVRPEEYRLNKDTPENPGCLKNQWIQVLASDFVDDHECRSTTVAFVTSCRDGKNTTSGKAITGFNVGCNSESTIAVCNSVTQ